MSSASRSILITGGTSGIGYYAAIDIAKRCPDHTVVLAARKDADHSAEQINRLLGQNNVQFMALDLSDLNKTRAFVKTWGERDLPPISSLLLNAGMQYPTGVKYTTDGFETTFHVNHLGHALLFHLLQPYLARQARIVITSSGTHDPAQPSGLPPAKYDTAEELAHPTAATIKNPGRQRYSSSKLCNVLWTYALNRRLEKMPDKNWAVVAFDPGFVPETGLSREAGPFLRFLARVILPPLIPLLQRLVSPNIHTPQVSGTNLAQLAMDGKDTGRYYEGIREIKSSVISYDESKQEDLWSWTTKTLSANVGGEHDFMLVH